MKILYNQNDEKKMKAFMRFEPAHNGKRIDYLLAGTLSLPTELSMLTSNTFQNHT